MRSISISKQEKKVFSTIKLPSSKSVSNRALIINALCGGCFKIKHLSESSDTKTLEKLLNDIKEGETTLDAGDGGTTFRFLTAYLALIEGKYILTGSDRMKERPIGILVDALIQLGAKIKFLGKWGYPPLEIIGGNLKGGRIKIDSSVSSQYMSALMMIAPLLKEDLNLYLEGGIVSHPYLEMTMKMMEYFGVPVHWSHKHLTITPHNYKPKDYSVEPSWTAASYWYEIASFCDEANIILPGLYKENLHGNKILSDLYSQFGVETKFNSKGIILTVNPAKRSAEKFAFDATNNPDIAQTLIATCAGTNKAGYFFGMDSLKIKETDRIAAMQSELSKFGISIDVTSKGTFHIRPLIMNDDEENHEPIIFNPNPPSEVISTFNDHRMAMAMAPLCIPFGNVIIDNPDVVRKSYPNFWLDLEDAGFIVERV